MGKSALSTNTASDNTAVGAAALAINGNGFDNTAVGKSALGANLGASFNVAVGSNALAATTVAFNTAVGTSALAANVSGTSNTAVGFNALVNSTGSNNIALGSQAGNTLATGSDNIYIGNPGELIDFNTIRIGTSGTHNSAFMAGINGQTSSSGITVLINSSGKLGTTTSSRRFKEDIQGIGETGRRLLRLRPVQFRYRSEYDDGTRLLQYGLIAEEVAEVFPELVVFGPDGQPETVRYHFLPPLLLNELQRQEAELRQQQAQNDTLRAELASLKAELEEAKQVLAQVANEVRVLRARQ